MTLPPSSPVLIRPDGVVQVGLTSPVLLARLTRAEREFVASLEGGRRPTEAESHRFPAVLSALRRRGAWQETAPAGRIAVDGDARIAVAVAKLLAALGFYTAPDPGAPTCAVLAGVGAIDPALTRPRMATSEPHIAVIALDAGAWISHVIVPGASACCRCRDVALSSADSAWPALAAQCLARPSQLSSLASGVVAARAAARVDAWVREGDVGIAESISEAGAIIDAPLMPSPECGCGAAGPVGDELAARRARMPR
jgi:hypothetical protein